MLRRIWEVRMITRNSKILTTGILAISVCALVLGVSMSRRVSAVSNDNNSTMTKISQFCATLDQKSTKLLTRFDGLSTKLSNSWVARDKNITGQWQQTDKDVAAQRQKADKARFDDFAKLEAKADTDDKKRAVSAYENSVNTAIHERRAGYDQARQTFRSGVVVAIEKRRSIVFAQTNEFRGLIITAVEKAKASCVSNPKLNASNRLTFQESVKNAQDAFKSKRSSDPEVDGQIKLLVNARNISFDVADQTFKAAMSTAKTTLQQAFDNTSI